MAAAYHWEARRKQMQVERRQRLQEERGPSGAGQPQQVLPAGQAKGPLTPSMAPTTSGQEASGRVCSCNTAHVQQNGGKLLKRYSTTEYIQQW